MDLDAVVDALNDLIRAAEDTHLALQRGEEDLEDPDLKALCAALADRRGSMIRDMQERVVAIGGAPDATGTLLGGARRMVAEFGVAIGARGADDILEGLERSQQDFLEQLTAARAGDLPDEVGAELDRYAECVIEDRDRLTRARATGKLAAGQA